jgi:uncharacterized membrane protein YfcA
VSAAWLPVLSAVFLIGLTKSGFGSGAGLLVVPLALLGALYLPGWDAHQTLALILPLLLVGDVVACWQHRQHFDRGAIARLLPGSVVGIVAGSLLLRWFVGREQTVAQALVNLEVGCESLFLVGLSAYRHWRFRGRLPPFRPARWRSGVVGLCAGFSSTLAHAAGPIIALHLLPQRLDRRVYVGTCAFYFLLINAAKVPGYLAAGLLGGELLPRSAALAPLVLAGAAAGYWINRRLSDRWFSLIVQLLVLASGLYLLVLAARQLGG